MEIPIIVEPSADKSFRASSGLWGLEIEAPTREEAIRMLRELIGRRLDAGAELLRLEIGGQAHPLARFAGMFKNDPLLSSWKLAMAEYRRQSEEI
jgi:hypothetical protein